MKKIDLKDVAEEFEMISSDTSLFYNKTTGEFNFYCDFYGAENEDYEKFEEEDWIAAPDQQDINEYRIMEDFIETITNPRKNELLSVAIEGKGAFRRFKDTLHRVDLTDEWYDFKHKAFVEIAREWCKENDIEYIGDEADKEAEKNMNNDGEIDEDTDAYLGKLSKILIMMEANPVVTVEQIALVLDETESEIESLIDTLINARLLKRSTRKGGSWISNRMKRLSVRQ